MTLLVGASGVFGQLKDAVNTIWNVQVVSGGWKVMLRERLLSFGMVLVIGFLLLVSFSLSTLLSTFSGWIEAILNLPTWIWGGVGLLISLLVVTLLFALIFKVLPDVKIRWQDVWIGAFFTAMLFEVGKFGLALYLGRESTASSFGAAGSVVLLLLWVYYASCILLFGAEFTKEYAAAQGVRVEATKMARVVGAIEEQKGGITVVEPLKESLVAIFPSPKTAPEPPTGLRALVSEHMAASLAGGMAFGLAVGVAGQAWANTSSKSPEATIRTASRMFGAAALVLAARYRVQTVHLATAVLDQFRRLTDRR